jgi:LysM domain
MPIINFAGDFMRKLIISLICCLLPALAYSDTLTIKDNAPDRYVVVKGDTLWDISAKFFKDPWKWPEIWDLNKESIKNPHWIYPGDMVLLDRNAKTLKVISGMQAASGVVAPPTEKTAGQEENENVEKLSPQVRVVESSHNAIASIPLADIEPFLKRPLIIEERELDKAPVIISGYEGRKLLSNDDIAYVKGLPSDKGLTWQVYRPGKPLTDPESGKLLGYEAVYLGNAHVEKFGDISTLRIYGAKEEIYAGDHLVQVASGFPDNFIPRAPDTEISAHIISIVNGITMAGQKAVVVINKGKRDGVQSGHVLALYRKGAMVKDVSSQSYDQLPNTRYGLLFVFRTFENVSYALVMETRLPVELSDIAKTP